MKWAEDTSQNPACDQDLVWTRLDLCSQMTVSCWGLESNISFLFTWNSKAFLNEHIALSIKVHIVKLRFFREPVQMWELDHKEGWEPTKRCCWTVVLDKTLESPLDCKEIQPVHSREDQPWVFFGRNDAKAETPVLWPPHANNWLIGKDPDAGRDWGQEEKGTTEDEMGGWHHWLNGREFEWSPGDGDGQGGLVCCDSWGCKESDTTEQLN